MNSTFHRLPDAGTFDDWRQQAPQGFLYTLKFSRYGSHLKCLKDPADTVGEFMDRAERLEDRLGPVLVQLRPDWKADMPRPRRIPCAMPRISCAMCVRLRDKEPDGAAYPYGGGGAMVIVCSCQ